MNNDFAIQQLQKSKWLQQLQTNRQNAVVIKLDKQEIPQLHKDLVAMDIQLLSLHPRHSLEDYFLQVTSGKQHVDAFTN